MGSGNIEIRGARENNLRGVDLTIPKHAITIFTGVSGSGKSSIVFDTIATEAQRQLYENFSMFIRNFLPKYPPPAADAIEHLNMAVIVDQKRLGGGSHSTVGTVTDIYTVLRLLFSRAGKPHAGYANVFSFNDPQGMCPECSGLGRKLGVKSDGFLDMSKSLAEGAVQVPVFAAWENNVYAACGFFDVKKKLSEFTQEELDLLLHGTERKFKTTYNGQPFNARYEGIISKFKSGSIYVMDEPTTGLHMSDITHLLAIIDRLVDAGNTVIVIEHNLDVVRHADWIIDLGPEGGSKGGKVVFEGPPAALVKSKTSITAEYLRGD